MIRDFSSEDNVTRWVKLVLVPSWMADTSMPRCCSSAMRAASCWARWDDQVRKPIWELKVLMRDWSDAAANCAANGFVADGATDGLLFIRHLFLKLIFSRIVLTTVACHRSVDLSVFLTRDSA